MWETRVLVARVPRMLFVSLAVAPLAVFFGVSQVSFWLRSALC